MNSDDAAKLVRECMERYQRITEYRDHGVVRAEGPPFTARFETRFKRGVSLSFAFNCEAQPWNTFELMADFERQRYSRKYMDREKSFDDVGLLVGAATGVSLGAVTIIAQLLMPDQVGAYGLDGMGAFEPVQQFEWDGEPCWSLAGRWRDEEMRLVIEKRRGCLRRVERSGVVLEYLPTVVL